LVNFSGNDPHSTGGASTIAAQKGQFPMLFFGCFENVPVFWHLYGIPLVFKAIVNLNGIDFFVAHGKYPKVEKIVPISSAFLERTTNLAFDLPNGWDLTSDRFPIVSRQVADLASSWKKSPKILDNQKIFAIIISLWE
jgi:hypothetical protein